MTIWRIGFVIVVLFGTLASAYAQEDCAALVAEALAAASDACAELEEDQACYGYAEVQAAFIEGLDDLAFEEGAEPVPLAALQALSGAPADVDGGVWGVAVLQATLDEAPTTFLLMGEVALQSALEPDAEPDIEPVEGAINSTARVNLRAGPTTGDEVVTTAEPGETLQIIGLNEAGDWYQIQLEDGATAWIADFLVTVEGDVGLAALPVVGSGPAVSGPGLAQAFVLTAGDAMPACAEAVNALVIQSEGAAFALGDMALTLDGTAAFGTVEDMIVVFLIEGQLRAAAGEAQVVLGESGQAFGLEDGEAFALPPEQALATAQNACYNAAEFGLLSDEERCEASAAFVYTVTVTNDLDRPVMLWVDGEAPVAFDAEETKTFPVAEGEHEFQVCNEGADPGGDECGEAQSRLIDEDKTWAGWQPE